MIDPKWTPGPWKWTREGVVDTTNTLISISGIAQPHGYIPDDDESNWNGKLIAHAPELYQAVEDCRLAMANEALVGHIDFEECREFFRVKVDPILAKARGEKL